MTSAAARRRSRADTAVILVVEDEILVRMAIALDLVASGYEVIEASDAASALDVLENGRAVDVVFSDIQMPGPMNGLDLCRRVRERYPHIPVVLTSAHGAPPADIQGAAPVFIAKPYLSATVLDAVRRGIDAR